MKYLKCVILLVMPILMLTACGGSDGGDMELPTRFPTTEPSSTPTETPPPTDTIEAETTSPDDNTTAQGRPQIGMPQFQPTATPVRWFIIGTEPAEAYSCPDIECDVLHTFEPGDEIEVISTSQIWQQILWEGNTDVYVLRERTALNQSGEPTSQPPPGTLGALSTPATQGPPSGGTPPPTINATSQPLPTDSPPEGTLASGTFVPVTSGPPVNSSPPPGITGGGTVIPPATDSPPTGNLSDGMATATPFNPLTPPPTPRS